jgi:hypothetical protein
VERCLACEADGERSDTARTGLVAHLWSTSFEDLDPDYRNAMLQSVEIEKDVPRGFPCLPSASQARHRSNDSCVGHDLDGSALFKAKSGPKGIGHLDQRPIERGSLAVFV